MLPAVLILLLVLIVVGAHLGRTALVRRLYGARIENEVRALFGEKAQVTHVAIDTSWRLVLGANALHIPGDLSLDVTEARLRGYAGPGPLVVDSLEGTLRWRSMVAPVSYRVCEKPDAPLHGRLVARSATWRNGAPPFDLEGPIRIAKNDYSLIAEKIECDGAKGSGELRGTDGPPRTKIHFEEVGPNLLAHLVALLGEHPLAIPSKSKMSGDLEIGPDFARRLDANLVTETSKVAAALRVSPDDRLEGSKVTGTLSFADANEARIFTARIRPQSAGDSTLDLDVKGPTKDWVLSGSVRSARVSVDVSSARRGLALVFAATEAVCALEVTERGVTWSGFEASFLGGRVSGSGTLSATGHASSLSVDRVRIEDLPVGNAEPLLRGLARGSFTIKGHGDDSLKLEGSGDVELAEPDYPFLRGASAPLATFGLPALPTRGSQPLRARLEVVGGRVVFRGIEGRVEGMRFAGNIELTWAGALAGRIEAQLDESYLKKSLLLALPAIVTGQVTVPLEISGVVGAPRYHADLVGTLGQLVSKNSVTGAIGGIVDGLLGNLLGGERRDGEDARRRPRTGLGGLFDSLSG